MYPHESTYPFFEANQVLKRDDLNNLFEYLDEQNRMTRTNLIGIGIVCGIDLIPNGNKLKITKGIGVTSEGYLVTIPEVEYANYKTYAPNKDIFLGDDCYTETNKINKNKLHKMVEGVPANQIFELVEGTPANSTALTTSFLADKIVLIYVELSKNGLKNCSPNSCDDKGSLVSVTFRRFLISKANADAIKNEINGLIGVQSGIDIEKIINAKFLLPDIRLRRFDVPNTNPVKTSDIVAAYQNILTKSFIEDTVRANLVKIFEAYESILNGLNKAEIQNWLETYQGSKLSLTKPYEYQYYYDFVSDLIQNYQEIRAKGFEVLALCNPDCRMFPRHLFLGEANIDTTKNKSTYRQYFIPSPIIGNQKKLGEELRLLFERLLATIRNFKIPQPNKLEIKGRILDANIRITPSKLGDVPISKKAIPYYYELNTGTPKLYETWSFELKNQGKEKQNLSYNANLYPAPIEDFVLNPLEYDLEPYNFFRIEGIVGKPFQDVMAALDQYIRIGRLPFDVVALSTGNESMESDENLADFQCHFADLEAMYDIQRKELFCLFEEFKDRLDDLFDLFPRDLSQFTNETLKQIRKIAQNATLPENIKCKIEIILGLVMVYRQRLAKLKSEFIFSNYTKKHPGIQHKAGVPMGGTFVLVYHGNVKSRFKEEEFSIIRNPSANAVAAAPATRAALVNEAEATAKTEVTAVKSYMTEEVNILGLSQKLMSEIEAFPIAIKEEIVRVIEERVRGFINETEDVDIEEGIVFADFYLPYRCCADCTPVQVVAPPKPTPLAATVSAPKCDESNKNFSVTITISGGTKPYTIDSNPIPADTADVVLKSGSSQDATIKDANNQEIIVKIPAHTCQQPCDLPCEGKATRCLYPLWLTIPTNANTKGVEVAIISFSDDVGNSHFYDFKSDYENILKSYNSTNFNTKIQTLIDKINDGIAGKIGDNNTLILQFDSVTQLISIEHYVCHKFEVKINFEESSTLRSFKGDVLYNPDGYSIRINDLITSGKKFGCIDLDKCAKTEKTQCKEPIDKSKIKLLLSGGAGGYKYELKNDSGINPDMIFWIFETEIPQFSDAKSGSFISRQQSVKVRLIFIKGPCFVIIEGIAPNQG
ncbi:MAG: hypothetical protein ACK4NY_04910 [Spirosomataceae bacterium]